MSLAHQLKPIAARITQAGDRTAVAWEQIAADSELLARTFRSGPGFTPATVILPEPGQLALDGNGDVEVAPGAEPEPAKGRKPRKG